MVGRARDLARLEESFGAGAPLITLLGTAGIGKTTLARRFAESHRRRFGPAVFCDLTEAHDAQSLCEAVARAAAAPLTRAMDDAALVAHLGEVLGARGPALFVLDNVEQIVGVAERALDVWLSQAPEAQFLVTSRERLRSALEIVHELEPLSLPLPGDDPATSEAVQLFVARVQALAPGYAPGDEEARVIGALARELDGLPLAIELAAARSRVLGAATLLARVDRRFDVLTRPARGVTPRQATLRAAIDASWDPLSPAEQDALAQCSVFRGSFDAAAAEAVIELGDRDGPSVLDLLQALRDKSLLRADERGDRGEVRLALFLSIREYAGAKLASAGAASDRHAAYFVHHAEALQRRVDGPGIALALEHFDEERDNLLAAADRCLDRATTPRDPGAPPSGWLASGLRLLIALAPIVVTKGPISVFLGRLERALDHADAPLVPGALRARALLARAELRARQRRSAVSSDLDLALSLARVEGAREVEARALLHLAQLRSWAGAWREAHDLTVRALGLADAEGARGLRGEALSRLALAERFFGHHDAAIDAARRALSIHLSLENVGQEIRALAVLVNILVETSRIDRARAYLDQLVDRHRRSFPRGGWADEIVLFFSAIVDHAEERFDRSRAGFTALIDWERVHGVARYGATAAAWRAVASFELGRLSEAQIELAEVLGQLDPGDWFASFCEGVLGVIEAELGNVARGRVLVARARAAMEARGDELQVWMAELASVLVDLAEATLLASQGDTASASALREEALRRREPARAAVPGGLPVAERLYELRVMMRMVARALGRSAPSSPDERERAPLLVHAAGQWFIPPGGEIVRCEARHVLARLLLALARARRERPGEALSPDALIAEGWPGQRILHDAAANRLRGILFRLRELGLRHVLRTREDGYLLDPAVEVRLVEGDPAAACGGSA